MPDQPTAFLRKSRCIGVRYVTSACNAADLLVSLNSIRISTADFRAQRPEWLGQAFA
jgi:hypothetical protein